MTVERRGGLLKSLVTEQQLFEVVVRPYFASLIDPDTQAWLRELMTGWSRNRAHFRASRGLIQTEMGEQTFVSRARNLGSNDVGAVRQQAMSRHPIGPLGVPR